MQLFVTDFVLDGESVVVDEERVVHQCMHVLRMKRGDRLQLQTIVRSGDTVPVVRYELCIRALSRGHLVADIVDCAPRSFVGHEVGMCVAMPNASKKLSLIVQKLTEL